MMCDASSTFRLFKHRRVAEGYVSARPFLHPEVFAIVRRLIGAVPPFRRALDVGCGTGMSSVAVRELAEQVIGVDVSEEMLRRAGSTDGVQYLAASAEALPFRCAAFDLIVACGSIDWVDRSRFLPRVSELLRPGGWLIPMDFGDTARSPGVPGLETWYRNVFLSRLPRPPSADPMIGGDEAATHGFSEPVVHRFKYPWPFSATAYTEFLLTESSVIAAVEHGRGSAAEIRHWLISELEPLFGGREHEIEFTGYIQLLRSGNRAQEG